MPPTGWPDSLTAIASFLEWYQPSRVLDVGVGGGRMGFLVREYGHQPWNPRVHSGELVLHGIEGHAPYLGPIQEALYDELFVGEAIETLGRLARQESRYELVVASDILEHFAVPDGRDFLRSCASVGDVVLVATPRSYFEQTSDGNDYDTHRSFWPEPELLRAGATSILHRGASTVCLFGDRAVARSYAAATHRPLREWILPPAVEDVLRDLLAAVRLRRHR